MSLDRYYGYHYSSALPRDWVHECARLGFDVQDHFVWLYDDLVGRPAPVTDDGEVILSKLCRDLKYFRKIREAK